MNNQKVQLLAAVLVWSLTIVNTGYVDASLSESEDKDQMSSVSDDIQNSNEKSDVSAQSENRSCAATQYGTFCQPTSEEETSDNQLRPTSGIVCNNNNNCIDIHCAPGNYFDSTLQRCVSEEENTGVVIECQPGYVVVGDECVRSTEGIVVECSEGKRFDKVKNECVDAENTGVVVECAPGYLFNGNECVLANDDNEASPAGNNEDDNNPSEDGNNDNEENGVEDDLLNENKPADEDGAS